MDDNKMPCPICGKEFAFSVIESHASKCLFLNESAADETTALLKDSSPIAKKSKVLRPTSAKKNNLVAVKRKSSLEQFSTQDVQRNEEDIRDVQDVMSPKSVTTYNGNKKLSKNEHIPLAEQMRPTSLLNFVGQEHILGPHTMLSELLQKGEIPNMILWGPPGCGKTSLANVIAHRCKNDASHKLRYVKLSAAMAGVQEVKEVISVAANHVKYAQRTIVFMDEIHRFNKMQQDVFLPHVESGSITLIGATTENPSFSLNSALLSRCRVTVLHKLSISNLVSILRRAVTSLNGVTYLPEKDETMGNNARKESTSMEEGRILGEPSSDTKFIVDGPTLEWLAGTCDGDARIALGGLEMAVRSKVPNQEDSPKPAIITLGDVKESLKKTHMLYDKKGDQHYDMISALHKSVRASDENASLYWLTRMISGGEDPVYIARRLVRMASEDVGLADPKALGIAVHTMHGCKMIGMPECDVLLAQCTTYLARAPKSRLMEDALRAAQRAVAEHKGPQPGVPLHLRNAPTKLMKDLGYGKGYNMRYKEDSGLNYLPEGLEDLDFFGDDDNSM
ncbi:ATPase WRNIP1 [Harpegnathos saltator]|uniref:ATPase WRNIP1 n=1 Tax=Harpegnathos saltator TaxID=610380 RepID=UPI000DBEE745|nr:ATPase WRNIP1 [Harpegnathos saltator]XP_011153913.2 ATPase WRNIP1 [Harpegnathos saltator]XP_011153914.2 ATPase WRNIP1 [Harpegnathos saltator]